jgi:hypothetical protein
MADNPKHIALSLTARQKNALRFLVAREEKDARVHIYALHRLTANALINRNLAECEKNQNGEYVIWATDFGRSVASHLPEWVAA